MKSGCEVNFNALVGLMLFETIHNFEAMIGSQIFPKSKNIICFSLKISQELLVDHHNFCNIQGFPHISVRKEDMLLPNRSKALINHVTMVLQSCT